MYIITIYGSWNYECYAYDLDSVPMGEWQQALKAIFDSGEEVWGTYRERFDPIGKDGKKPDKVYLWNYLKGWVEDEMYENKNRAGS